VAFEEKPAAVLRAHLDAQQDLLHCYARLPALVLQAHSSTRLQACYVMLCSVMLCYIVILMLCTAQDCVRARQLLSPTVQHGTRRTQL
jgi:hypothetical protein